MEEFLCTVFIIVTLAMTIFIVTFSNKSRCSRQQISNSYVVQSIQARINNIEKTLDEKIIQLSILNSKLSEQIEELKCVNADLYRSASRDGLTNINNRYAFLQKFESHLAQVQKNDSFIFTIISIDLDNFKYYNDTYGHATGDMILINVCTIFKKCIRNIDFLARYGGDEFMILLKHANTKQTKVIAEKILSKLKRHKGFSNELSAFIGKTIIIPHKYQISCSIGIIECNHITLQNYSSPAQILKRVDDALYNAKKAGKCRICVGN